MGTRQALTTAEGVTSIVYHVVRQQGQGVFTPRVNVIESDEDKRDAIKVLEEIAERRDIESQIVVTSAKRVGNKWQVTYNTIEFAENGNELDGLLGNHQHQVADDGVVTGVTETR